MNTRATGAGRARIWRVVGGIRLAGGARGFHFKILQRNLADFSPVTPFLQKVSHPPGFDSGGYRGDSQRVTLQDGKMTEYEKIAKSDAKLPFFGDPFFYLLVE